MSKYNLLFGPKLCERILKITDHLSMTLQTESLSAAEAQSIATDTIDTLKGMRTHEKFQLFFKLMDSLYIKTVCEEPVLPRHQGTLKLGVEKTIIIVLPLKTILRHCIISSIEDHFNQPGYAAYKNLESLLKVANQADYSAELQEVVSFYGDDLSEVDLATQL